MFSLIWRYRLQEEWIMKEIRSIPGTFVLS